MTIIAIRNGIIASDSRMTYGNAVLSDNTRKIVKAPDGTLAGASGSAIFCTRFLNWVESGLDEKTMPKPRVMNGGVDTGLLYMPGGTIRMIEPSGFYDVESEYMAIGSGSDFAMGAMACGANAIEAVAAAIKHEINCGGGIVSIRRDD